MRQRSTFCGHRRLPSSRRRALLPARFRDGVPRDVLVDTRAYHPFDRVSRQRRHRPGRVANPRPEFTKNDGQTRVPRRGPRAAGRRVRVTTKTFFRAVRPTPRRPAVATVQPPHGAHEWRKGGAAGSPGQAAHEGRCWPGKNEPRASDGKVGPRSRSLERVPGKH